jgi:hypothetical protein
LCPISHCSEPDRIFAGLRVSHVALSIAAI